MRVSVFTLLVAVVALPRMASAEGDISDTLKWAAEIVGDDIAEGYEEYVEEDPDEALSVLLSDNIVSRRTQDSYVDDQGLLGIRMTKSHQLTTLGNERLTYDALRAVIAEASKETGLPASLIDAVIRTESGYRPGAVSRAGAKGLMQLTPEMVKKMKVRDPFDVRENVLGGAKYLKLLYDQFGTLRHAVAAYNAGPEAVKKHGRVPPFAETIRYVDTVMSRHANTAR